MYFKSFVHGRILIIRWLDPSVAGSAELAKLIERCHVAADGPLFFASIVGAACPTPSSEAREAMRAGHESVADRLTDSRTVILGRSIRQSLMRSVLLNIALLAGRDVKRFVIDGSAEDMAAAAQAALGVDPTWLLQRLIDAGMLEHTELTRPLAAAPSRP